MAFRTGARVRETSTAPGTGSFTVNGAVQGAQSLASVLTSNADTCWYGATNGTAWEEGTLTRTSATVYARSIDTSSNSNSAVNFSSGSVDIYLDLPSFVTDTLNLIEITVASATTTDIGVVKGAKIVISGTTTITGLGTSTNKLRFVRFSGALTLTHNGTSLILPGATNITTAAGDTAVFMSDASGNWRCYSYTFGVLVPFDRRAPGAIGGTTPAAGTFTTLDWTSGAWTSWSPTVASTGGTITTVGTVVAAYKQYGKLVQFWIKIPITTLGTASGKMTFTLPVSEIALVGPGMVAGWNDQNFKAVIGTMRFDSVGTASVALYDGTFPVTANGTTLYLAGSYEIA